MVIASPATSSVNVWATSIQAPPESTAVIVYIPSLETNAILFSYAEGDTLGLTLGDTEDETLAEGDTLGETLGETDAEGDILGLTDGLTDGETDELSCIEPLREITSPTENIPNPLPESEIREVALSNDTVVSEKTAAVCGL